MRMVPLYKRLKGKMWEMEVTFEELSKAIGKSQSYMCRRSSGKAPFDMDDVYRICDFLYIPYSEIPEYFPPNGVDPQKKAG